MRSTTIPAQGAGGDDEYVHNLGRILKTLAKEARERGGAVGEILGQGLVSWQGTVGIGLVPFLAKKAGSGECWIFVRKGERWALTRSIADAMQIITGGVPKRPYRADERELNQSKSIMTRVLGGKAAWAEEMERRWKEAVASSRIEKDRSRRGRSTAAGPSAAPAPPPAGAPVPGAAVKHEPAAQMRGAPLTSAPAPPPLPAHVPTAQQPVPAAEVPSGAGVATVPSSTAFPLSIEAATQWFDAAAAGYDAAAAAAAAPRRPGQALRTMDIHGWTEFDAIHTKLYVLAKELAAAKACLDVIEQGEKRWTAQEPPAPAWHRVKANAVGAVIQAGDLEASCMLYAVNDPATAPGTAAQVAEGYDAAVARCCELVSAAETEALRLDVTTIPHPAGLSEWAAAAAADLERRGVAFTGAGPHVHCDKREYCCLPAGHRGHCRKPRPDDDEPALPPVMGKRRSALAAAAAAAATATDYPIPAAAAAEPEDDFVDVVGHAYQGPEAPPIVRTNAEGEQLCTRNPNCVKLAAHMGRCKIRGSYYVGDEEGGAEDGSAARREPGTAPGGSGSGGADPDVLPPGVEKCTRHKHCVKEQGHMGRCRIRAPPRRPPGAAARERKLKEQAAAAAAVAAAGRMVGEEELESGESMDEDMEFESCPKDPDCVNMAGHRGRCKIRRAAGAEAAGEQGPVAKRPRPGALEFDLGHLALLAEMAAMPSPGFVSPGRAAGAAAGAGAGAGARSPGPKGMGGAVPAALPSSKAEVEGAQQQQQQQQQQGEARVAAAAAAAVAGAEEAAAAAVDNATSASPAHLDVAAVLAAAAAVPEEPEEVEATAEAAAAAGIQPVVEIADAIGHGAYASGGAKPEELATGLVAQVGGGAGIAAPAAVAAAPEAPMAAIMPMNKAPEGAPVEIEKAEGGAAEETTAAAPPADQPAENGAVAITVDAFNAVNGAQL